MHLEVSTSCLVSFVPDVEMVVILKWVDVQAFLSTEVPEDWLTI